MTDLRKAAEMALKALEHAAGCVQDNYLPDRCGHDWDEQIEALRQALAQPEQEVVKQAYLDGVNSGIAAKREACTKVCKEFGKEWYCEDTTNEIIAKIQARGEK